MKLIAKGINSFMDYDTVTVGLADGICAMRLREKVGPFWLTPIMFEMPNTNFMTHCLEGCLKDTLEESVACDTVQEKGSTSNKDG